jgi:hypothetical protein
MITLAKLGTLGLKRLLEAQWAAEAVEFPGGERARKIAFSERLLMDAGRHRTMILRRIAEAYEDQEIVKGLSKHVDRRRNLFKRVASTVAIAYDTPPSREIKGVADEQNREFLAAYAEADTDTESETWGRAAFTVNVVHVAPRMEDGKMVWVTVLPHCADVVFDPRGERDPSILTYMSAGTTRIVVDSEAWYWLDKDWRIIDREDHRMGVTPWSVFRWCAPPIGDYWDRGNGEELRDAGLEVSRVSAQMSWVRKTNSKDLLYFFVGQNDEFPPMQSLNGETPFMVRGDRSQFGSVKNIVPVDEFVKEISDLIEDALEGYGLPVTAVDFATGSTNDSANVFTPAGPRFHERQAKLRNKFVKHHTRSETTLADRVVRLLRASGRLSIGPDDLAPKAGKGFRIRFAPMTFADHPKAQVATAQAKMEVGATDQFEFYQELHPGLDLTTCEEEVMEHLERRSKFLEEVTKRQLGLDPSGDAASVPQAQGRIGGFASGQSRKPPPKDGEDEEAADGDEQRS